MNYVIAGALVLISAGAVSQEKELFTHSGNWCAGFDSLWIGMPASELWSMRLDATVNPMDAPQEAAQSAERRGMQHQEVIRDMPVEGVDLLVKYEIADDKLDTMLMIWVGDSKTMKGLRSSFVEFCFSNFGEKFQPEVIEQYPNDVRRHLAPLLCWDLGQHSVSVSCTPDLTETDLKKASFSLLAEPNREDSNRSKALRPSVNKGDAPGESRRRVYESAGINLPNEDEGHRSN